MMDHIYKGILDSLDSYIVVVKEDGTISFTNSTWGNLAKKLSATENADWVGKNYYECCHMFQANVSDFANRCQFEVEKLLSGGGREFTLACNSSSIAGEIWLELTGSIVTFDQERYVILNHSNIIDRKKDHAEIEKLTLTDAVTQLANQKSFNAFYFNEWQRSMRNRSEMALLIGELDTSNSKVETNQLKSVANIFKRHARRACDLAAILKNNQFALVLGQVGSVSYESVAESIYQEISRLNLLCSADQALQINIGISSATPTLIDTSDMLYNAVILALNKAKTSQQHITSHCPTISFKEGLLMKN